MVKWIILLMTKIISPNQSAFITRRSFADNILLSQYLVKIFQGPKGPPRMSLKLDLSKAFDSIKWDIIKSALQSLNSQNATISWILSCVENPTFSILVNGKCCGYSNNTRGLRQDFPLSPNNFCIVMEFFSAMLHECATTGIIPTPFTKENPQISHLLYANDLMLFSNETIQVARNIKKFLHHFWLLPIFK